MSKTKTKSPPKRKTCAVCEKTQAISNFYNANSPFFPDNKMHVCKECSLKIAEDSFDGFQALMKLINKPIYEDLFKEDVGDYVRQINSLPQYRENVYEDSTKFEENKAMASIKRAKPTELTEEELRESEDFWGRGYTEEDYIYLNLEYGDYLNRYEVDSKTLENLIREICLVQLDIRNNRSQGKDVKNELKTYDQLLAAANLKPSQSTGNQSVEQETFSTLIRKFENERPVPEPDPMWRDVDNIGKYIRTFFLGHMAKMFGKENPYIDEYEDEIGKHTVKPPKRDEEA